MSIVETNEFIKDILAIETIVIPYFQNGILDRQKALEKIDDLRSKDLKNIAITKLVTTPNVPKVTESSNQVLIDELCFWKNVLIVKKGLEENNEEKRKQVFSEYGLAEETIATILSILNRKE